MDSGPIADVRARWPDDAIRRFDRVGSEATTTGGPAPAAEEPAAPVSEETPEMTMDPG